MTFFAHYADQINSRPANASLLARLARPLAWVLAFLPAFAGAQTPTVHYTPPIVTLGGGLSAPTAIAVDASGNVFVADTGNNAVKEIPPGCVSSSCVTTLGGGFNGPQGINVDSSGNVYVADTGNNAVKEIPAGCTSSSCVITLGGGFNGPSGLCCGANSIVADTGNNAVKLVVPTCLSSSCVVLLSSGFNAPSAVAIDSSNTVYVADTGSGSVKLISECGGPYQSCVTMLSGGFNRPAGVAVDFGNRVYVADTGNNAVEQIPTGCASLGCAKAVGSGFNNPRGLATDGRGNLYVADSGNNAVKEVLLSSLQFPTEPVQTTSGVTTLTFTFDSAGTIGAPAVLTMGASGLDFADAGSGSCTTNGAGHPYSPGDTCTVDVTFTPKMPGLRKGAVELVDTSAAKNVLSTELVYGTGTGPQAVFSPPAQTFSFSGNWQGPHHFGVATDGAGNVYLSTLFYSSNGYPYGEVDEIPSGCASSGCTTKLVSYSGHGPDGIALDGAGNLYIANEAFLDLTYPAVYEMPAGCKSINCVISLGGNYSFSRGGGIAVDGSGSVYVADGQNVWKVPAGCTDSSCVSALGGGNFDWAAGVAVDGNGTLYVATGSGLAEMPSDCTDQSCVHRPLSGALSDALSAVALDGGGNIYVGDMGDSKRTVKEVPVGCASPSCVMTLSVFTFNWPQSLALDDGGNVYVGIEGQLLEINRATPPTLTFPTPTPVGATDTADDPQTATVHNIGNAALSFPLPTTGTNPSVSANFTWDEASTCVQTDPGSSSAFTLAAGASCAIAVDFAPDAAGAIGGSVILTDNSLYAPGNATQSIPLSGHGIPGTPVVSAWPTASTIVYGQTLASSALAGGTVSVAGTFAWTTPSSAPGAGINFENVTFTPTDTTDYVTVAGTVSVMVNKATPMITWAAPAAVSYGTALSSSQMNATASVPGTFAYTPAAGVMPGAGIQALTAVFTPIDAVDYESVTKTVQLTVNAAALTVKADNQSMAYGDTVPALTGTLKGVVPGDGITATFVTTASSKSSVGQYAITATLNDPKSRLVNYSLSNTAGTLTVGQATPAIAWAPPAAITYGMPLGSAQLNATSAIAGTFAYSPAAGAVLAAGPHTLKVAFTPTDAVDYTANTQSITLTVDKAALSVAANNQTMTFGGALPALTGTLTGVLPGDSITATYATKATASSPAGQYPITATLADPNSKLGNYTVTSTPGTLTIGKATPTITWATPAAITYGTALGSKQLDATASVAGSFAYSPAAGTVLPAGSQKLSATFTPTDAADYTTATTSVNITVNQATPTAKVSSTAGTPTGSVNFFNGTTQLGSATLSGGMATYTTSALTAGSYTITAQYAGDSNFTSATSNAVTETVASFAIATPSGGSTSSTVSPGGTATYNLSVTPPGNNPVTFSVTGMPSGATSSFSPSTVPAGAPATKVTLSVTVPSTAAAATPDRPGRPSRMPLAFGLLLLPLLGLGRLRKAHRILFALLLCLAGATGLAVLSGCGGGGGNMGGGGGGQQPQTYNLTVTATAGSQTQTTTLTLTVE
jgi:hypothetical protein